jgi:DNA-binding CsgD family transcriptional regulator
MTDELPIISEREREILRLIAIGATNQQIASQLSISINTVKVHVRNIYEKIGVVSRSEATLYAVRAGIVAVELAPPATQVALLDQPASAIDDDLGDPVELAEPAAPPEALTAAPAEPVAPSTSVVDASAAPPPLPIAEPLPAARPAAAPSRTMLIGGALIVLLTIGLVLALIQPWRGPSLSPTAAAVPSALPSSSPIALPAPDERWRELAPMPEGRFGFALARFRFDGNTYLYAIGGEVGSQVDGSVLRYDLDAWVRFRAKPTPVSDVQAAVVGNRIFVPGGRTADGQISSALEAYDPQRDSWQALAPLPEARAGYALAAVEGKLYLFGGVDGEQAPRAEVWQYNPDLDTWQPQTAMSEPRSGLGSVAIDDQIFLMGGENASGPLTLHQRYNPAEEGNGNPYTIRAPLPAPRSHMGLAEAGGLVFLFGGSDQSSVLIYDSASDSWRTNSTPLVAELSDLRADASDNRLYLFGGRVAGVASERSYAYQALYQVIIDLGN